MRPRRAGQILQVGRQTLSRAPGGIACPSRNGRPDRGALGGRARGARPMSIDDATRDLLKAELLAFEERLSL
jgi:hypothetical protein